MLYPWLPYSLSEFEELASLSRMATQDRMTSDSITHVNDPKDIELAATANKGVDPYLVTFEEPFDADNPR